MEVDERREESTVRAYVDGFDGEITKRLSTERDRQPRKSASFHARRR